MVDRQRDTRAAYKDYDRSARLNAVSGPATWNSLPVLTADCISVYGDTQKKP